MPDPALLTERGRRIRDSWPPIVRDDPDYLGIAHACARELDLMETRVTFLRAQLNPATATADGLLSVWEHFVTGVSEPVGHDEASRRVLLLAGLLKLRVVFGGTDWQDAIERLVGPGYTYEEHDPADLASPPANTIRITLPYSAISFMFGYAQAFIRAATPAHIDILFAAADGFVLDSSPLDLTDFGGL